jgi:hypothetical protein
VPSAQLPPEVVSVHETETAVRAESIPQVQVSPEAGGHRMVMPQTDRLMYN